MVETATARDWQLRDCCILSTQQNKNSSVLLLGLKKFDLGQSPDYAYVTTRNRVKSV
jgi:hypothetical protein